MVRNTTEKKKVIDNPHGGTGRIEIYDILKSADTLGNVSLLAKVIIHPETIINYHQHTGEAEAYYILKGDGFFINNEQERIPVKAGDVCLIEVGQGHGMENPYDETMEMMALVFPGR